MKISSITKQVRSQDRVNIFIDGKYSFSLTLDDLLKYSIKKDLEIDEAKLKQLKKISQDSKLKQKTLSWLLLRPRSIKEFKDYLTKNKAETALIEEWLIEWQKKDYLNDHNFARWWQQQRLKSGRSDRFISSELYKKGVNQDIIKGLFDNSSEDQRIIEMINKKRRQPRYKDDKNLIQYLIRQGFSYGKIKQSLKQIVIDD